MLWCGLALLVAAGFAPLQAAQVADLSRDGNTDPEMGGSPYHTIVNGNRIYPGSNNSAEQRLKNAQEAAQRVSGQQPMYSGYGAAGLAASKRLEELLKKN